MQDNLSTEEMDEITELIFGGQKIAACKRYMEIRSQESDDMTSLLDAKKFVEGLTDELRESHPERFTNAKSGCSMSAIACVLVFGACLWVLIDQLAQPGV